jgi:hypothetical protein
MMVKKLVKLGLATAILGTGAVAVTPSFSVIPWIASVNYSKTTKKDALTYGVYGSILYSPIKVELQGEKFIQKYRTTSTKYSETDGTIKLHYYLGNNWDISAGYRGVDRDNPALTGSAPVKYVYVTQVGVLYYVYGQYNAGLDYYFSNYKDFKVSQYSPKIGYTFLQNDPTYGTIYGEARVDVIHISKDNITYKKDYADVTLSLEGWYNPYYAKVYATLGKNTYRVDNGGFVVYTTGDEYQYTYGLDIGYTITKNVSAKIGYSRSQFKELGALEKSYANVYSLAFTASF